MPFCSKCGTKIAEDDLFCPECGERISQDTGKSSTEKLKKIGKAIKPSKEQVDSFTEKSQSFAKGVAGTFGAFVGEIKTQANQKKAEAQERKSEHETESEQIIKKSKSSRIQEFAGVIIKCPNCGEKVSQTTAVCPLCGHQITGQHSVYSVQAFSEQLMKIESKRRRKLFGNASGLAPADPVDKQKLELIKNFPIPNTVDDILEFMLLAISNIDVNLSKKRWNKPKGSQQLLASEMPMVISDAWVSKMEQVYQKAKYAFPNNPAFAQIENIYYNKMKELKYIK